MESFAVKQVRIGRNCSRCKVYFVTENVNATLCPWCQKVEDGLEDAYLYEEEKNNPVA